MAVFKKHLTPIGRGGITKHSGKGSQSEVLPSRHALNTLTAGNVSDRTMQNYAKATPMANPSPDPNGDAMGQFPPIPGG